MSSVIGIIGTKVQNLALRVGALHTGRSDEIRKCVLSARLSNTCFLKLRLKLSLSTFKRAEYRSVLLQMRVPQLNADHSAHAQVRATAPSSP